MRTPTKTPKTVDDVRILDNVEVPEGLVVTIIGDPDEFFQRPVALNKQHNHWFGSAMKQGNRLQFLTTMPVHNYLSIAHVDQATRGATVEELKEHYNRPNLPPNRRGIKAYLNETAYAGDKWIFPNFMLNFGVGWKEEMAKGELILLVTDEEAFAWPALFIPPTGQKMPVSDGAHRTGSMEDLSDKGGEGCDLMLANGVGVTIVFEPSSDQQHQDFTDLAKSVPVSQSVKSTWDLRDIVVKTAKALVLENDFLKKYVDSTSPSVNLSSNSVLIWSMSAVRGSLPAAFTEKIDEFDKLTSETKAKLLETAPAEIGAFFDELTKRLPIFVQLQDGSATPAVFRKQLGGCVLMRGAGFGFLMRAFRYARQNQISYADMADMLSKVNWFVLPFDWTTDLKTQIDSGTIYEYLRDNAHPAWFKLIAINPGTNSWRLKGTNDNLNAAFQVLMQDRAAAKAEAQAQAQAAE